MKRLLPTTVCVFALTLSSCSLLNSAGSMLNGMVKALGRTVSQTDTPSDKPITDPVAERGVEIASRGAYGGSVGRENPDARVGVASR